MQSIRRADSISSVISKLCKNSKSLQISQNGGRRRKRLSEMDDEQLERRKFEDRTKLLSYLSICIDTGHIQAANKIIRKHVKRRSDSLVEARHYNIVLQGLAKANKQSKMIDVKKEMIKNKIKHDCETYATFLYMLSKSPSHSERITATRSILKEMKEAGIPCELIFQSIYLNQSERDSVRELIRSCEPTFSDQFWPSPINYNCNLLDRLRETEPVEYKFAGEQDLSKLEQWAEEQRQVETRSSVIIRSVVNLRHSSSAVDKYEVVWKKFISLWRDSLTKALEESMVALRKQMFFSHKIHLLPYLSSVDVESLVNLMLDEVENNAALSSFSLSTRTLHVDIGHRAMLTYLKSKSLADGSHFEIWTIYRDYLDRYCRNSKLLGEMNPREFIQHRASETKNYAVYKDKLNDVNEWPDHIKASVGRFLYGLILREVKFDPVAAASPKKEIDPKNLVHVFYTAYFQIDSSHKFREEFRVHRDLESLYKRATAIRLRFNYSSLPCSSPPMPWLSSSFGGYLTNKSDLVRSTGQSSWESQGANEKVDVQKLYPSLDSLNSLSLCPWIVNKDILDIVIDLFRAGGDSNLKVPLHESRMDLDEPVLKANATKADRILYNKEKKKHNQRKREMYSLWADCLYRLSIANHFRDRIFWLPHNMDFRGRTYPIPPHFNHLGADLARSLLLFARGVPLGERGLDWLKIHVVNLVGNMKSDPIQERLEYANSILESKILDSAENPFTGNRWWMQNEHPWQVLACCIEIARAVKSDNPAEYVSHFPVHQDGSCNGLQHYAALGRDPLGATAVNLVPSEAPQDVYSRVVELVEANRQDDAAKGLPIAKRLEGFISRKVIKQTVMTTVYGVTRYGARQQIYRQLTSKAFPDDAAGPAANYLASKTFESIGQMFNASRRIQDWFNDCARLIAGRYRKPVSWETPLGFPVVQPYHHVGLASNRMLASDLGFSMRVYNSQSRGRLNASKQKTAFPPNYIHSLDSSHMMLTSLFCHRRGITFVSVHDCYWTHPASVDEMNKICREQFVALHSLHLLEDLSRQFLIRYEDSSDKSDHNEDVELEADSSEDEFETDDEAPGNRQVFNQLAHQQQVPVERRKRGKKSRKPALDDNLTREATLHMAHKISLDVAQKKSRAIFKQVPQRGDFDLDNVLKSVYFFS